MKTPVAKPDSITRGELAEAILLELSKTRVKQSGYTFSEGVEAARRMFKEEKLYGPYVFMYRAWADSEGNFLYDRQLYAYRDMSSQNREVHDGLRKLAGYILHENRPLPDPLRQWLAEYLLDKRPRPKLKKGNPGNRKRDLLIRLMVQHLVSNGMTATRNEVSDNHDTACDAVAQVVGLSYPRVKVIKVPRVKVIKV